MGATPFRFGLEPEFERRMSERDACERRVHAARDAARSAETALEDARRTLQRTRQRIAREHDHQRSPTSHPLAVLDRAAFIRGLEARAEEEDRQVSETAGRLRSERHRLSLLVAELDALHGRVRMLERLREKEHAGWKAARAAREEDRLNEEALLTWTHRRMEEDR